MKTISKNAHDEIGSRLNHLVDNPELLDFDEVGVEEPAVVELLAQVAEVAKAYNMVRREDAVAFLTKLDSKVAYILAAELNNCAEIYQDNMPLMEDIDKRKTGQLAADLLKTADWLRSVHD